MAAVVRAPLFAAAGVARRPGPAVASGLARVQAQARARCLCRYATQSSQPRPVRRVRKAKQDIGARLCVVGGVGIWAGAAWPDLAIDPASCPSTKWHLRQAETVQANHRLTQINTDENYPTPPFSLARIHSPVSDPKPSEARLKLSPGHLCPSEFICGCPTRGARLTSTRLWLVKAFRQRRLGCNRSLPA